MSSIKEQVLAQQQGQYSESDDKYLSVLKQYNCDLNDEEVAAEVKKILDEKVAEYDTFPCGHASNSISAALGKG